ncbi:MAG: hypothetical protein K0S91_996 [Nitrososphaeraceae archaeon]|jgi:hypothetical protein|nr:hypothetical protein [Nitrososphaeraceae archaeon]
MPKNDIIHREPIDDPMKARITAVIMNGLLT